MTVDNLLNLDLPYEPDFVSEPSQFTVTEMVIMCAPLLPYNNRLRAENPEPIEDIKPFVWDACLDTPKKKRNED